jgi:hypothetical protein
LLHLHRGRRLPVHTGFDCKTLLVCSLTSIFMDVMVFVS